MWFLAALGEKKEQPSPNRSVPNKLAERLSAGRREYERRRHRARAPHSRAKFLPVPGSVRCPWKGGGASMLAA